MTTIRKILFAFLSMTTIPLMMQGRSLPDLLLLGKVIDVSGKPIPGVPVTDGSTVVDTDKNGDYRIHARGDVQFVYITLPSGYEIPQENGLPRFYREVKPSGGKFRADFVLKRMEVPDEHHFTIVWADPQVNKPEEVEQLRRFAVPDTRRHADSLSSIAPVQGIVCGDLMWDAPEVIPSYKQAIAETHVSFFQVLGNHDMDLYVRSDEHSDRTFKAHYGPTWYSFNRGKAHYVVLDNVFYYGDRYFYIGYITEQQFRWLEQDLARVKPGSLVFVSMHIPAYTNEKTREKKAADNPGNVTLNRNHLYRMLKPFRAHILTGHTHYNENRIEDNIFEHTHASVCGTWWLSELCVDGTPSGYAVYEVDNDSVRWYYKSVGQPIDYQFRVYKPGTYASAPEKLMVNIWNWDESWKAVWYEDGRFMGELKRETDFDMGVKKDLARPDRPAKYSWAGPSLTDHLFSAVPGKDSRTITIVVTDRFGTQYTQDIHLKS